MTGNLYAYEYLKLLNTIAISGTIAELIFTETEAIKDYLKINTITISGTYADANGIPNLTRRLKMKHEVRLHNKWKVVVTNTKTGATREAVGENIILNQFWTKYLSAANATCLSYIHVGEGTDTPVATNTKLKTPFASYSSSGNVTDYSHFLSDGYITRQLSCRVEANTYVGKVIAEVGFAYSGATTGSLVTHALLKDMNGNAVTITIGADEVINIFGTVYFDLGYSHNSDTIFLLSGYNEYLVSAMLCFYTFSNINRITSTSASGYDSRKLKEPFSLTHNIIPNSSVAAYSTITFDTDNKKADMGICRCHHIC